ncbi:hypothetical protein ACFWN2_01600 [Lentzea sp. NPDC058436]|uniref:hypothetical protein n=1 Tax=Lentzea sp. NPDC058436 TaxID=3346499 RepID=UPI0036568BD3
MNEPTHQQWLDDVAQQAQERIASLHEEGLESLRGSETPRTTPPVSGRETEDARRFGGLL